MINRSHVIYLLFLLIIIEVKGQTQFGIGKNQESIDAFERLSFLYDTTRTPIKHLSFDLFRLADLGELSRQGNFSQKDRLIFNELQDAQTIRSEHSSNKGVFFKQGNIFSYKNDMVSIKARPLLYFSIGNNTESEVTPFQNTRGIEVSGNIGKKVFFRTSLLENQARFLPHIEKRISDRSAIPGNGFYKRYQSNVIESISGWDYLNAEGVLTYRPSKYFRASIGHGSHFLGHGYQSLFLSDYADNFFFLEFNTSIGIFNYKNIFAELAPIGSTILNPGDPLAPKKYMATHYLSVALSRKLELSLFETVIFGRENHFEFQYLNPLILYRVVEQKLDSPDNVMIGLEASYKPSQSMKLYGQLLLDEFRFNQAFSGNGWWGNKVGYQLGLKYFNAFGMEHFDLLAEFNTVRPFTYSHRQGEGIDFVVGSNSHYNQELAHSLGANFREWIMIAKHRINHKWSARSKLILSKVGRSNTANVGQDVLAPDQSRVDDFDNFTTQGEVSDIFLFNLVVTYHLGNGFYADAVITYRNEESELAVFNEKTIYSGIAFRANLGHQRLDY